MTDRKIGPPVIVEVPLSEYKTRLLERHLRGNPNNERDVGNVTTRRGVFVWEVERRLRGSSNRRLVATRLGITMKELRAAQLWTTLYEDDIDRRIEVSNY